MKNKIKKLLFSGILSLVLVFAVAFASLSVLRTNDHANADSPITCYFRDKDSEDYYVYNNLTDESDVSDALLLLLEDLEPTHSEISGANVKIYDSANSETELSSETKLSANQNYYYRIVEVQIQQAQAETKKIEFRPVVVDTRENVTKRVYINQTPEEVVVNYYVTYNYGVNSFVLVPSYDKDVFTLLDNDNNPRVAVNGIDASAITVTGNVKGENDPEFVKIAFDSSTLYDAAHEYEAGSESNVLILTLTFSVTAPTEYGHFRGFFGLVLDDEGKTNNTSSVAYKDLSGDELGGQEEVSITLDVDNPNEVAVPENVVDIYKRHDATITTAATSVEYTYRKQAMPVTKVTEYTSNLAYGVEYIYNGNGTPVITWKEGETVLPSAPQNAGTYTVTISVPATDTYSAPEPKTITVTINPAQVTVKADNKTSAYAETPQQLTYTVTGLFTGDSLASQVTLTVYKNYNTSEQAEITLSSSTNVGDYTIVPNTTVSSNYTLTLTNGSYKVTKYETTIYVASWISEQTFNGGTKTAYAAPNVFICDEISQTLPQEVLDLLGNYTLSYEVNFPEGVVPANDPENEYSYYVITPSITLVNSELNNNFNFVISPGTYKINPAEVTLKAGNKSAEFNGGTKANYAAPTLYYVYVGNTEASEALRTALGTVTFTVNFPAEGVVNAGTYTITPGYTANSNFVVTTSNGTYTINTKDLTDEEKAAIYGAFGIVEVTYDGQGHTMYTFDASGLPLELTASDLGNRYSYLAKINDETASERISAGTYPVTIIFTINDTTINQNRNSTYGTQGYQPLSLTFEVKVVENNVAKYSSISKKAITITAADKGHTWGSTPQTLTPQTAGIGGEINVTFTVQDANEQAVTLSQTTPVRTYTIVPSASNSNYNITLVNGTYTVSKATPVLSIVAMDTDYNKNLYLYKRSVTVGNLNNNDDDDLGVYGDNYDYYDGFEYVVNIYDSNNNLVVSDANQLTNYWLDAGEYTAKLVLTGTDNYNSASASSTFEIEKVYVGGPNTITYNGNTVTWSEVTKDVDGIDLHNSTVTYTISGTAYANRSFTATAKGTYYLTITTSNTNYKVTDFDFDPVYSVTFLDGTHTANPATPTNMPEVQYVFKDQYATQPATNPSLTGYTFAGWNCDSWEFNFNEYNIHDGMVNGNGDCYLTAQWTIIKYTVTFKYTEDANVTSGEGQNVFTAQVDYNSTVDYQALSLQPTKSSDNAGIEYQFANKWLSNETEYTNQQVDNYAVTANVTFVAQYTTNYISFTITYYVKENGGNYVEQEYTTEVAYNSVIEYSELETDVKWFTAKAWFANADRTVVAPVTMPNHDMNVYGAIVFDIGTGDVNGDGNVNANDITLYRQWIVGGYSMTVVEAGTEWKTATAEGFNPNGVYFLMKVADNNIDLSRDIRDVSITRMSIVGGYYWDIDTGVNVTGSEIVRNVIAESLDTMTTALNSGKKVTLTADVTSASALVVSYAGHVTLDLNGKTLTVAKVDLTVTNRGTLTVKNGTIVTTGGITLRAPYGNVTIDGVTGYDKDGVVNLQAAQNSLHLAGLVKFYEGVDTTGEKPVPAAEPVKAAVKVAQNTHVVVEAEAELVVEKLVVAKVETAAEGVEFTVPELPEEVTEEYTISIESKNDNLAVSEIEVTGFVQHENEIKTYEELVAAGQNGGSYTLMADLSFAGSAKRVYFYEETVLDLNGHTITSTNEIPLAVDNGGKLTINGKGNVNGREACVIAFRGSELVVNDGTYTCTDNFVLGTNGSTGYGGNKITVNGGVFNGGIISAGYIACGIYVANNDTVVVNGGTFNITDGVGMAIRAGEVTVGSEVVFNCTNENRANGWVGDNKTNLPAGEALVVDLRASYPGLLNGVFTLVNESEYVAVKDVIYTEADLNAAVANGGRYVLMADVVYSGQKSFPHDTTIYLNGKKLQSTNDVALSAVDGATLTLNGDGEVKAQEACVMAFDASKVVINGGTYTAYDNFVLGTNGTTGRGGNTITVNAGTFNGGIQSAGYVACGIYVANSDTVVVNAGTFNVTNGVGILARSGNTTVGEDVVLNVTGNSETLGKVGDSRVVLPAGSKLVLDFVANYPGGDPTLTNNTNYDVTTIYNNQAVSALVINNLDELKAFRNNVNEGNNYADQLVILNANISLDGAWLPISNYSRKNSASQSQWFAGTFDGRGHTISNLSNANLTGIDTYNEEAEGTTIYTYGLFGSVNNAVIKNLSLLNVNLSSEGELLGDSVGALVGFYANSTQKAEANISNITVSGTVAGADNVGGVVGRAAGNYFKVAYATVSGTVTAKCKASGIVGTGNAKTMEFDHCVNKAAVSSTVENSNQGHNTVAGISITWQNACQEVVLTECSNNGTLTTCNEASITGQLAADYSPKTALNENGTWAYTNGQWTKVTL